MAIDMDSEARFNRNVLYSLVITSILLLVLPMFFVVGKSSNYSAYDTDGLGQLSDMRESFEGEYVENRDSGYYVANTMSTPMLVNDWKDPHRTLLTIIAPEKPIDQTEADEIFRFVTEKGGKVIVAADNTQAHNLAILFGVRYMDAPLLDDKQHWVYTQQSQQTVDWGNVWSASPVNQDIEDMSPGALMQGCTAFQIQNPDGLNDCRLPVMYRGPTGMMFEPTDKDIEDPNHRSIMTLGTASPSAFIDRAGDGDPTNPANPATGDLRLMMRFDYPGIKVLDKVADEGRGAFSAGVGELEVTGSIVFVADDEAFSNMLWELAVAKDQGLSQDCSAIGDYTRNNCWTQEILNNNEWNGNERYFRLLAYDMMEFDNVDLNAPIRSDPSNFQIVFDESRHVTGVVSEPFVQTMGTVVLLTSNQFLKWLVVLNVTLLLLVAMMVVPEKENWRHVFDLTKFNQRPEKLDPATYRDRVRKSLLTKVRIHHDLTRDEMAMTPPPEVQAMIGDPRLVELAYSQSRTYTPQELRKLMKAIRRWGKNN